MRDEIKVLCILCAGLMTLGTQPRAQTAAAPAEASASVRLEVSEFRNTQGTLNCRLFAQPANFPDGAGARDVRVAIDGRQATCVFSGLPQGTYAVAVVHDENGNGQMDKNLLGIPSEGYGVSNNRTYALSSPKWEESRFNIGASEATVLRVSLRY